MEDRELYQTILGLHAPWTVSRVELRETEQAVHVWAEEIHETVFRCPDCGASAPVYDRGAPLAAPRYLPVHDGALRPGAARPVPGAWGQDGARAVGRDARDPGARDAAWLGPPDAGARGPARDR